MSIPASPPRAAAAVRLTDVTRTFAPPSGGRPVRALAGVDLTVSAGSFTALVGPSGSGKSTLLHCAAGLERCDDGRIELAGTDITRATRRALAVVRSEHVGFIFQEYNLIASRTVRENVELPLGLRGGRPERRAVDAVPPASASARAAGTAPPSSPAESSSASRSLASCCRPRGSSSPMSPPAPSTSARAAWCSTGSPTSPPPGRPS